MKLPFIIYVQALGIYLVLTSPALVLAPVYVLSAMYALTSGLAAMAAFAAVFFILHRIKPPVQMVITVLIAAVITAVAAAYKLLLWVIMPERDFFTIDLFILFPVAAVLAGFTSIAINRQKIKDHFDPPFFEGFETIFTYPKKLQV
jgi:hypothetical protein